MPSVRHAEKGCRKEKGCTGYEDIHRQISNPYIISVSALPEFQDFVAKVNIFEFEDLKLSSTASKPAPRRIFSVDQDFLVEEGDLKLRYAVSIRRPLFLVV